MEEGVKACAVIGLALAMAAAPMQAQTPQSSPKWLEELEKRFPPVSKNAAAEELETLSLALGIGGSFGESSEDSRREQPTKEDLEAYGQAQFLSWLDSQVKAADDSIGPPPPKLKQFLERRQATVSRVVSLLVREVPEWGFNVREKPKRRAAMAISTRLNGILLSAVLVEERAGRHGEAAQNLEASWSLLRSLTERPSLTSMLVAVAMAKQQTGTIRKMNEVPFQWLDRMADDTQLQQILAALENDSVIALASSDEPVSDGYIRASAEAWRVFADTLRKFSPCQVSELSAEAILDHVVQELKKGFEPGDDSEQEIEVITRIVLPNLVEALRRTARLLVDRELTLKILELRQEKAASRMGRWPKKFFDASSKTCPEESYEYQPLGAAMRIRFPQSVDDAGSGLVLPLSFEARAPKPTRTPRAAKPFRPHS